MQSPQPNQQDPVSLGRVPSSETVLRRVLDAHYHHETGSIHAKAFVNDKDDNTGETTDRHSASWEKYTSASKLLSLAPNPERFGVVAVEVEEYEAVQQKVKHSPKGEDYGHSDAIGDKTAKVKNHLRKRATVRITPPQRH